MLYPIARPVDRSLVHEWRDTIIFYIGGLINFTICSTSHLRDRYLDVLQVYLTTYYSESRDTVECCTEYNR